MKNVINEVAVVQSQPGVLFECKLWIYGQRTEYKRAVYNIQVMLEESGGLVQAVLLTFALMIWPISKQSFILSVAQKLYVAKVTESDFFKDEKLSGQKKYDDNANVT